MNFGDVSLNYLVPGGCVFETRRQMLRDEAVIRGSVSILESTPDDRNELADAMYRASPGVYAANLLRSVVLDVGKLALYGYLGYELLRG